MKTKYWKMEDKSKMDDIRNENGDNDNVVVDVITNGAAVAEDTNNPGEIVAENGEHSNDTVGQQQQQLNNENDNNDQVVEKKHQNTVLSDDTAVISSVVVVHLTSNNSMTRSAWMRQVCREQSL